MARGSVDLGNGVSFGKLDPLANGMEIARRQTELGLLPRANFNMFSRETLRLRQAVVQRARQKYILPRILEPTPVSFFEPGIGWTLDGDVRDPQLDMSMIGRLEDEAELEEAFTQLPGFTFKYSISWREQGIAQRAGRPIETMTSRAAINRMLRAANKANIEGAKGGRIPGLLNQVSGETTISANADWGDPDNATPVEDFNRAIAAVAARDIDIPSYTVLLNTKNWAATARRRAGSDVMEQMFLRQMSNDPDVSVKFVPTTAMPVGTALGIPNDVELATLFTTGLPQVVPVKADAEHAEWVVRMIAVEQVFDQEALFLIEGLGDGNPVP